MLKFQNYVSVALGKYLIWFEFSSEPLLFNVWQVLSCRLEVHSELVQQVLLLMGNHKQLGMVEICEFLQPFLNYSILRIPFSDSLSSMLARHLVSSIASFCCLFPLQAIPVFKLLTETLKYVPCKSLEASHLLLIGKESFCWLPFFIYSITVGVIGRISIFIST